jgi:Zn-dependent protease with chaperone function
MAENPENPSSEPQGRRARVRVRFEGIQSGAWEHPADKVALKALQSVPGLDSLIRNFFATTGEKSLRLMALASSLRVTDKQFGRVNELHREACRVLDLPRVPELFVAQNPIMNAGAVGMDDPFVVINSSMVEALDDDELLFVLGHELGHIKSNHMLYRTLLVFLIMVSSRVVKIPLGELALWAAITALKEWSRKSELSTDRAGLLTVQDPEVAIRLLMKMAGGRLVEQMDLGEFMRQAEEYRNSGDALDGVYKVLNLMGETHPFAVIRVYELMEWVRGGQYDSILRGFYPAQDDTPLSDDMKAAAESYKKSFSEAMKPLEKMMDEMRERMKGSGGKSPWEFFDEFTGRRR